MTLSKAWWAVLAVVPVGLVSALVLDGGEARREVILPAGTSIVAALQGEVSTARSRPGEDVELRSVRPLPVEGDAPIPAGAIVRGQVTEAEGGGRMGGAPELGLSFRELEIDGERYPIQANIYYLKGKGDTRETVAEIGGGAVAGGILGGVLGGGSGAAKGAVVGAAIGTGVAAATEGDHLVLRAGHQVAVKLTGPVKVAFRPEPETEKPQP
jgi:hypothetical protein